MTVSKSLDMVDYLQRLSNKTGFDDLKEGLNGIFESLGNSLIVRCLFFLIKRKERIFI